MIRFLQKELRAEISKFLDCSSWKPGQEPWLYKSTEKTPQGKHTPKGASSSQRFERAPMSLKERMIENEVQGIVNKRNNFENMLLEVSKKNSSCSEQWHLLVLQMLSSSSTSYLDILMFFYSFNHLFTKLTKTKEANFALQVLLTFDKLNEKSSETLQQNGKIFDDLFVELVISHCVQLSTHPYGNWLLGTLLVEHRQFLKNC